jgi:hypothetical protein
MNNNEFITQFQQGYELKVFDAPKHVSKYLKEYLDQMSAGIEPQQINTVVRLVVNLDERIVTDTWDGKTYYFALIGYEVYHPYVETTITYPSPQAAISACVINNIPVKVTKCYI